MAYYAFIDNNNIVTEVIPGRNEDEVIDGISDWETHYAELRPGQNCKRTSYNTVAGIHLLSGTPFRKNYAGIGYTYDEVRDAFIPPKPDDSEELNDFTCTWIPPQPFPSWTFNTHSGLWKAPTSLPGYDKDYKWDEETLSWIEIPTE